MRSVCGPGFWFLFTLPVQHIVRTFALAARNISFLPFFSASRYTRLQVIELSRDYARDGSESAVI
jgi:hypothetical protein